MTHEEWEESIKLRAELVGIYEKRALANDLHTQHSDRVRDIQIRLWDLEINFDVKKLTDEALVNTELMPK